jgi:hypothetical protein
LVIIEHSVNKPLDLSLKKIPWQRRSGPAGWGLLSRIIPWKHSSDISNSISETFPQERRRIEGAGFLHFPTLYRHNGRRQKGWINVDPYRGLLIMGSPGSGKSWLLVRSIIRQQIADNYAMVLYDFKYPNSLNSPATAISNSKNPSRKMPAIPAPNSTFSTLTIFPVRAAVIPWRLTPCGK